MMKARDSIVADQERDQEYSGFDLLQEDEIGVKRLNEPADYIEETSAEIAAPTTFNRGNGAAEEREQEVDTAGRGVGFAALILSILSLFIMPFLFGATGIILGFVARGRGATSLGNWAIGIGVVSIIIGTFILPFFR